MNIKIEFTGTSPLLMHNPQMVDPEFEINRQIQELTKKRNKTDADRAAIERLEWYGGIYTIHNGHGIEVVQPTAKMRKSIIEAARISKRGKTVERALSFAALNVPLIYPGPRKLDDLYADKTFRSRLSVGIGNKRVIRVRPQFSTWALTADGLFVEDAGMNFDELQNIVDLAGQVQGIGDNRVNGYGRFIGKVVKA